MTLHLIVDRAGPSMTVQDTGRPDGMGLGLSRGGAADRFALIEGAALLGNPLSAAAIEISVTGGRLHSDAPTRIALTGADMRATLDGARLESRATYRLDPGAVLEIGAVERGVFGYLHVAGGLLTEEELGGRGRHRIAGLGHDLSDGDRIAIGTDTEPEAAPLRLPVNPPSSAPVRTIPGPQTSFFPERVRAVFESTDFVRSPRGNRQGVRLDHDGSPFGTGEQLNQVSDFIAEGDIQMTGDGTPFVLLAECQTMGGYPRIGTVIPADLPRIAQAMPGHILRFRFVSLEEAEKTWISDEDLLEACRRRRKPRIRDPRDIANLLSYDLIDRPPPDVTG
jgi:allophanate hydrolase